MIDGTLRRNFPSPGRAREPPPPGVSIGWPTNGMLVVSVSVMNDPVHPKPNHLEEFYDVLNFCRHPRRGLRCHHGWGNGWLGSRQNRPQSNIENLPRGVVLDGHWHWFVGPVGGCQSLSISSLILEASHTFSRRKHQLVGYLTIGGRVAVAENDDDMWRVEVAATVAMEVVVEYVCQWLMVGTVENIEELLSFAAMSLSRITSRVSRTVLTQCRNSALLIGRHENNHFQNSSNILISSRGLSDKPDDEAAAAAATDDIPRTEAVENAESGPQISTSETPKRKRGAKRVAFSDSDSDLEPDLSRDDLVKLVAEKEQLLATKQEELEQVKDTAMRSLTEMENTKERALREAESAKKFAILNFAKSLLDVADNLGRASSAAKESFSKVDVSKDASVATQQLKTLLAGVEMTEKQLNEVFRKFGLEKYDPVDEEFDPNRHNAVFQVPDPSKPADRVAVVLKAGYILHDRVIRPAEVGVTVAANSEEGEKASED
ncbi:Co-chaperone GrpE family protein [Striga hermonthica]|uniref:GrpE protein homolog n=1 Tax=Striga hermonthica TaxID=68872 RepID=A0A9N7MS99_STRHE|nr:Co-chaperone GrpE family protein [Striga hermonthica]